VEDEYWYVVRRALTWPSGDLKADVSVAEYCSWIRCAYDGTLRVIYAGYPIKEVSVTALSIYNLAVHNTRQNVIW
jgi:hypothetical protein